MNYLSLFVILLVCGGAYYSYTIQTGRVTEVEQQLSDLNDKLTLLHADNARLTSDLAGANAKLEAARKAAAPTVGGSAPAAAPSIPAAAGPTSPFGVTAPDPAPPGAPASPVGVKIPDQIAAGIVVIKGDNAEGTGFLVKTADGPAVVTNLHVLANNPHLKIQTSSGALIPVNGMKGAIDRDLAMLSIQDGPYSYLPLAADVSKVANPGDADITPGNSQGGDVVLNTPGSIVALGPDRVEFNNPIYHGNSGGPVFHVPSGTVVAVVTEAMKVAMSSDLDKTSFGSRNSAIASSIRYFGLRLDNVPKWEPYDLARYENETLFLDNFDKQSRTLDAYLNPPKDRQGNATQTSSPDEKIYENDDRIMAAHHAFRSRLAGSDTGDQIQALRELGFSLDTIADKDMEAVKNPGNFYTFDQQRAHDALAYRQALKKEISEFSSDVNRIGNLPRTND